MNKLINKNKSGRPVDLSGINIEEIREWLSNNKLQRKIAICQCILALHNGAGMTDVCNIFGVTRESVRQWKLQLRKNGLSGLLEEKKVGKRSRLNRENQQQLKLVLSKSPKKQSYVEKRWTGKLVQDWVFKQWQIKISLRTAQAWMSKII